MDVSERHSGLHTQLPHGTLTHQETAPDDQRNCLDAEGRIRISFRGNGIQIGLDGTIVSHLNSAKIDQSVQADQLLDLFHPPHPTVAADHDLSEIITVSPSSPSETPPPAARGNVYLMDGLDGSFKIHNGVRSRLSQFPDILE